MKLTDKDIEYIKKEFESMPEVNIDLFGSVKFKVHKGKIASTEIKYENEERHERSN